MKQSFTCYKWIAAVRYLIRTKRLLYLSIQTAGCTQHLFALLQSIGASFSQPNYAVLLESTRSISVFFCEYSFIVALDTVVQDVLSMCKWNLLGKLATELFLSLGKLIALSGLHNLHCNLEIALRITETVLHFVQTFGPIPVQYAVLHNFQALKIAQNPEKSEEAVRVMEDLTDVRYFWTDFEGLFYTNFALALAHYHNGKSTDNPGELALAQVYFQRAINCFPRSNSFQFFEPNLRPRDLCLLFLSDLRSIGKTVKTRPYHDWKPHENPLLVQSSAEVTNNLEDECVYDVPRMVDLDVEEATIEAFFHCAAGRQPVLFLYDYTFSPSLTNPESLQ